MLHIAVIFINLLLIIIETGSINPYTYKGLNQKYFISTGDAITGITFDSPVTTAFICAFGLLYFLYNVRIRHTTFLTAQSIDANGELNTDKRLKEDLVLQQSDMNYVYFPRLSKLVDAGELILPCIRGEIIYLAKIEF